MSSSSTMQQHSAIKECSVIDGSSFMMTSNPFSSSSTIPSSSNPPQMHLDSTTMFTSNINIESSLPPQHQHLQQQQPSTAYQQQMSILAKQYQVVETNNVEMDGKGNGHYYQKFMTTTTNKFNDGSSNIDYELLSKFNRMNTQSPQLPRKNYTTLRNTNSPSYIQQQHHEQHHFQGSDSPLMQHKMIMKPDEGSNLHYSYKPAQIGSTYSPIVKKRYGNDGVMVSEDLEYRILHGNTSPIVLQRFYHQQNQLRDQKMEEEIRARRNNTSCTNPFEQHYLQQQHHAQSNIPIANNSYLKYTSSPTPQRHNNLNFYESNYTNTSPQQQNSYIPQYSRNTNGHPSYRHHPISQLSEMQQNKHDNLVNRPPIPSSPQLDRLRANLEKPNFYERHQLPIEVHLKDTTVTSPPNTTANDKNTKGMHMLNIH